MSTSKKHEIPKTLGACADLLAELRALKSEANKRVEEIAEYESVLREHIINTLPKGDTGAIGKAYKALVVVEKVPVITDFEAFVRFAVKKKRFDMLTKKASSAPIREFWENGVNPPGVESHQVAKVSVTKI